MSRALKLINTKVLVTVFIIFSFLSVLLFVSSDKQRIINILSESDLKYVLLAIIAGLVSYIFLSLNFLAVSDLLNLKINKRYLFLQSFVSSVVTNLLSVPFLTGYSTRFLFLKKSGLSRGELTTYVLIQSQLSNFMPLILLPAAFLYLYAFNPSVTPSSNLGSEILVLFIFLLIINSLIFFRKTRIAIAKVVSFFLKRFNYHIEEDRILSLDEKVSKSLKLLKSSPQKLFTASMLSVFNWFFSLLCMYLCFSAIGTDIKASVLVIGYVVGLVIGVASLIPGGVGIQEVSMAGIYTLFGVNFQEALLASILFRLVYYIVPFIPAYFIYHISSKSS